MSISDIKIARDRAFKTALVFLAVSLFCLAFSSVYGRYSHGVRSACMTFMFAYPLIGGALVYLIIGAIPKARSPGRFAENVYNSGIAALTAGSLLRGILDIAGTSSPYQPVFMLAGALMVFTGAACYLAAAFLPPRVKGSEQQDGDDQVDIDAPARDKK